MEKRKWGAVGILVLAIVILILAYSGFFHFRLPDLRTYNGFLPALVGISAIVDSLNPCAFSVLFLTVAFLFSLGRSRRKIVEAGLAYIFGIFATYVLIGLGILHVLSILNIPNIMAKLGALAIIIFGAIGLINEFFPNFPIKLKIPEIGYKRIATLVEKATIPTALILGFVVGLFEFPCTGGPYLFVLGLLHDQNNVLRGFWYLIFYNLMFVLPLLIALLIAVNRQVLEAMDKVRRAETKQARVWVAIIMILLGLLIFVIQ
ncbi:MAG: GAP family protein [Candidatus Paceibacterota bacterium]|jgi:cytochrome c biogenesis protein CcdA